MAKAKTIHPRKLDSGGTVYDFVCPYQAGCGGEGADDKGNAMHTPFLSLGWADKRHAEERGAQHLAEHKGDGPMEELHHFHLARGLAAPIEIPEV